MSLLHHVQLFFQALVFPSLTFNFHIFLSDRELQLGHSRLRVLQLLFKLISNLLELILLLLQIELDYVLVLELHFFRLNFAHLMEHFVLF